MTNEPPPLRFEPFIAKLEQASAEGRADFIAGNMPRLEQLIAECMDWQVEIAEFEYRCRKVRDGHEPPSPPGQQKGRP